MDEFCISIKVIVWLILLYISWEIYRKERKSKKLGNELQNYPPEEVDIVEASLIYRSYVEKTDIPAIVFQLANKGYLKIQAESELQDINSKTRIRLHKLKDYDGDNENEKIMFNTLFRSNRIVYVEELNSNDISIITCNMEQIKRDWMNKFPIKFFIILLIAISVIFIGADIYIDYEPSFHFRRNRILYVLHSNKILNYEQANFIYKIEMFFVYLGICAALSWVIRFSYNKIITVTAYTILNFLILGILYGEGLANVSSTVLFLVGAIVLNLLLFMFYRIQKRTDSGKEIYSQIKGLKKFLNNMSKEQLEELLIFDPYYVEKILPYTFIFKNTRRVLNKYEELKNVKMPDWYESNFDIKVNEISKCLNDAYLEISIMLNTNRRY